MSYSYCWPIALSAQVKAAFNLDEERLNSFANQAPFSLAANWPLENVGAANWAPGKLGP